MKKLFFIILALGQLSVTTITEARSQNIEGTCHVIGIKEANTNSYYGPTFCDHIVLSSITVRGPLQLDSTTINGMTRVSGPIKAKRASMQDIIMEDNRSVETINLQDISTVTGNIIFEGKKGIVYVENGSIIEGRVINGEVVTQ